ncbi:MAG: transcriptional regulator [Streptomycetaceae bacterium]|nr:transcriptional regulator [Streptomycetaceae bacterium]
MGSRGNADAARDRFLGGGSERGNGVAAAIHASWVRARATGIRPDRALPPVPLVDDAVLRRRRGHPLAPVWPVLRESLRWATCDTGQLLIVSDAEGHLLWCQGDPGPLRQAERVHMLPGALWSEDTVGTTAVSTAIALRRPFQVFGAEHYASFARPFACSAAPIHDPVTGRLLGTVDLTSATDADRALKLSLVTTAARLAEAQLLAERLRHQARLREKYADRLALRLGGCGALLDADGVVAHASPPGSLPAHLPGIHREGPVVLPDGRHAVVERLDAETFFLVVAPTDDGAEPTVRYEGLGRARGRLATGGPWHELTGRHSELVALLLAHDEGLTAEELAFELYGDSGRAGTVRAELSRLRPILGHRLGSEPYRILGPRAADFLAAEADRARLLPRSKAPGIAALRDAAPSG